MKRSYYRVVETTRTTVWTNKAKAVKAAQSAPEQQDEVYVLQQGPFDAWNTGVEIYRRAK